MTTAYTQLLGLALPVTGELSGTWGDTVNNSITSLIESAIAGTTTLSTDADVTLSNLDGTADTSRQAILLCTGARTAIRTIIAPALSKIYTVINSTTGSPSAFSVQIVAAGPTTGVTIVAGEAALIAWNGSDFIKVSNTGGSFTTQDLTVTGNTILGDAITDTTTLNAQTRFQSRGILGYANMTGPATTSLTTTAPAFLYSGATTYTVSDVSGGTQAFAPVISLDQATITNATTNTIYTNAATLYIAGAPNRTGLVTFTNSYALYVAAGASYLGGTLNATGVATFSAGTAAAPAITTTGDTNTGIWFPAADTIAFTEGGVESMRIDSSGRLLIGGTTTYDFNGQSNLVVSGTANNSTITIASTSDGYLAFADGTTGTQPYVGRIGYFHTSNYMDFWTNGTEKMRLDSSGRLGIGATTMSTSENLVVSNGTVDLVMSPGAFSSGNVGMIGTKTNHGLSFAINTAQKMAIDTSGNLLVGATSASGIITTSTSVASQAGSIWTRNTSASAAAYSGLTVGNDAAINRAGFILASSGATTSGFLAANSVYAYAGTGQFAMLTESAQPILFGTNNQIRALIDSSGNLGIGTTSPSQKLVVSSSATDATAINIINTSSGGGNFNIGAVGSAGWLGGSAGSLLIRDSSAGVTRIVLDSSGNLLVGTTSQLGKLTVETTTAGTYTGYNRNTNATPGAAIVDLSIFSAASPNNTTAGFYFASDNIGAKAIIYSNGGLHNYSANNVNLSDRREKTNFAPAGSYLDKICAIPVQTFNYIDQNLEEDDGLTLGVVAQDVQAVAPELVMESNWAGKDEEPKMRLSIYQTDLQYALMKCIQEQQALITQLTARITALEGA